MTDRKRTLVGSRAVMAGYATVGADRGLGPSHLRTRLRCRPSVEESQGRGRQFC